MSLASLVAFAMLALLIGWVGTVLYATFRQLDGESRERGERDF
jgi:multisubunit Na+/H+ antiporter MnhF subunit